MFLPTFSGFSFCTFSASFSRFHCSLTAGCVSFLMKIDLKESPACFRYLARSSIASRTSPDSTVTRTGRRRPPVLPRRRDDLTPADDPVVLHIFWILASSVAAPSSSSWPSGIQSRTMLHSLAFLSISSSNHCYLVMICCCLMTSS